VQFWERVISPNHNEIVVDDRSAPAAPASGSRNDLFWDWMISPNHNEIVVDDRA
jgi:hypothetical protein